VGCVRGGLTRWCRRRWHGTDRGRLASAHKSGWCPRPRPQLLDRSAAAQRPSLARKELNCDEYEPSYA
jgi:hypothetical protein